ncbi:MAG: TonB-dependent receptor [Emcibacter sp.]|nr:TonB-dependent receptor [Emcibacter sp.]
MSSKIFGLMAGHTKRSRVLAATTALVTCMTFQGVQAQTTATAQGDKTTAVTQNIMDFDIPASPLSTALNRFADMTGLQLVYHADLVKGMNSTGLKGPFTAVQGLYVLLSETGHTFQFKGPKMVIIQNITAGDIQGGLQGDAVLLAPSIALAERPRGVVIDKSSTGRALIGRGALSSLNQGAGDPMDAFTQLPNVTFSADQYVVNENNEQSLLPQEVSISGGEIYNNLITFDGLQTKSYTFDAGNDNPAHYGSLGISTTHMIILDAGMLEQVAVQDSNISAKYTGFSGGVIEFKTRDPKREIGGQVSGNYQSDSLTSYISGLKDEDGNEVVIDEEDKPKPKFEKYTIGAVFDIPITEKLYSMFSFSFRNSNVARVVHENYTASRGGFAQTTSQVMQFLGKLMYNMGNEDTLILSTNITPYESEFTRSNVYGDEQVTEGIGHISSLEWRRESDLFSATVKAFYSGSGFKRDAPNAFYRLQNISYGDDDAIPNPQTDVCNLSVCSVGGFGDIRTRQDSYGINTDFTYKFSEGDLNFGVRWNGDEVHNERFEENYAYSFDRKMQSSSRNIICADSSDLSCISGVQVITRRAGYPEYDVKVNMDTFDGYVEFQGRKDYQGFVQAFRYRAGVAAGYESYLKNFTLAPRFTIGIDFEDHWSVDLGANRYYTRNFLGYALRDGKPTLVQERRVVDINGTDYTYLNEWELYTQLTSTKYADGNLKTPYSDELTAVLTYDNGEGLGTIRLKGIYRDNKDRISRLQVEEEVTRTYRGNEQTYNQRYYTPVNLGKSSYRGLSIEWNKSLENHFFSLTATWSKTKTSNIDYYAVLTDEDIDVSYIADPEQAENSGDMDDADFANTLTPISSLGIRRKEFSVPWKIAGFWKAKWFEGKLTTSLDGKYIPSWVDIEDSGTNRTYDDVRYDVFTLVERKNLVRFNADISYELDLAHGRSILLNMHVNNLFNSSSRTATSTRPYEKGRSFIFGAKAAF